MTPRLYRIALVMTALVWLQVGMRLSHVSTIIDAGSKPALTELLLLTMLAMWGVFGVIVLWRHPSAGSGDEPDAPAA